VSQVFITFLLEKNPDIAAQEVRNKIDLILNDLPLTAEQPIVQKLDTDAAPVVRIAVSAPRSLREVTEVADNQIKQQIESINGVGDVQMAVAGVRSRSGSIPTKCALSIFRWPRSPTRCARRTWNCLADALRKARAN
jgi:HAE1 family hydrophobic/amphiphilic exporter-1